MPGHALPEKRRRQAILRWRNRLGGSRYQLFRSPLIKHEQIRQGTRQNNLICELQPMNTGNRHPRRRFALRLRLRSVTNYGRDLPPDDHSRQAEEIPALAEVNLCSDRGW
jgi:hypothetical protein